jgi:ribosomal protein S18 acetylase RimI-like enzyme
MPVRIRPYDPADFDALWQMDAACYAPEVAYSKRTMRAFLRLPGAECLIAEDGGAILGFIMTDRDGPAGHVITLDVSPDARRRGIGTALVNAAHDSLAARGVREVELESSTANQAGVAFWQHHGYQPQGILANFYENGEDAYWMTRTLAKKASA